MSGSTGSGRTAVSSHLRVLRVAGLVTERRIGRYRYYSVDPNGPARDVIRLLQGLFQAPPGREQRARAG